MSRTILPILVLFLAACPKAKPTAGLSDASATDAAPEGSPHEAASTTPTDVITSASPGMTAEGGAPPSIAEVEVDAKPLRDRHRATIAADKSPVTVLRGSTARDLGKRLCEAVVPQRPKDLPILIKPNMGGFEYFKDPAKNNGDDGVHGRTTDPEFVRGIVQCLKARGHTKITIAEGFAHSHAEWKRLIRVSGYEPMAQAEGAELVALDDDGVFDVQGGRPGKPLRVKGMETTGVPTLLMPKILAEHLQHGVFISAPKIKAHRFAVTSMAIKGAQGTVMLSDAAPAFHQKWRTHRELSAALKLLEEGREAGKKAYLEALHVFAERMTDLLEVSAPDVVLAEGAPAMGGDGFGKRWPSSESFAIGGTNPILVDRVGAAMLGLWDNADLARELGGHKTSPLIETAAKRFGVDITAPSIEGDGKALLDRPRPVHFVSMSGFALHSNADPPEGGRPEAKARRIDALTIDGTIDDAWKAATPVTFDTDWSGAETKVRTSVRFAWSKNAFYMLWELAGAGVNADPKPPLDVDRAKLYEEDCVELFLGPDPAEKTRYYEVEVGPLGHFLDIAIDRKKKTSDVAWSSRPRIATKVNRDRREVVIEVELSAPEIVGALRAGATLPLALYRMEGTSPRKYLAWSPTRTEKPNFHVPDAFGTLRIE